MGLTGFYFIKFSLMGNVFNFAPPVSSICKNEFFFLYLKWFEVLLMGIIYEGFRHFLLMVGGSARLTFEDPKCPELPHLGFPQKKYYLDFCKVIFDLG